MCQAKFQSIATGHSCTTMGKLAIVKAEPQVTTVLLRRVGSDGWFESTQLMVFHGWWHKAKDPKTKFHQPCANKIDHLSNRLTFIHKPFQGISEASWLVFKLNQSDKHTDHSRRLPGRFGHPQEWWSSATCLPANPSAILRATGSTAPHRSICPHRNCPNAQPNPELLHHPWWPSTTPESARDAFDSMMWHG